MKTATEVQWPAVTQVQWCDPDGQHWRRRDDGSEEPFDPVTGAVNHPGQQDGEPAEEAVLEEVRRLRLKDRAVRALKQERAQARGERAPVLLPDFLAVPDEPVRYRVDGLWPVGGRVVCSAQYKAGKTTLLDNLLRALVDEQDFLGSFAVNAPAGRVVLIDNELDERMLRRWLREQGIAHPERVAVISLRGLVGTFDLLDEDTRGRWAARLRAVEAGVVLFDCLRPVLDALGLSEDKEAGTFLVAFDALLAEAGCSEAVVIHHMGHNGERSRGDARIRDWPDVEWSLVREKGEEDASPASARRFFAAYGRDVDQPEGLLEYDVDSRRLSFAGGTRNDAKAAACLPDVLAYLGDNPGATQRAVIAALATIAAPRREIVAALKQGIKDHRVDTADGPRRAILHFAAAPAEPSGTSAP